MWNSICTLIFIRTYASCVKLPCSPFALSPLPQRRTKEGHGVYAGHSPEPGKEDQCTCTGCSSRTCGTKTWENLPVRGRVEKGCAHLAEQGQQAAQGSRGGTATASARTAGRTKRTAGPTAGHGENPSGHGRALRDRGPHRDTRDPSSAGSTARPAAFPQQALHSDPAQECSAAHAQPAP